MISECNFANGSIDDIEVIIIFKAFTSLIKRPLSQITFNALMQFQQKERFLLTHQFIL